MTWVADVQLVNSLASPGTWAGHGEEPQPYMIVGLLARIHPDTLPVGRGHLVAHWVTLNSRTIPTILPWLEEGTLVYHHTLRLVEGVLTPQELEQAQKLGCVVNHRSGHWIIPMGDARKRLLSQIRDVPLICSLCGAPIASIEEATVDHRIPSSQGGPDVLANLQLAHKVCNEFKGNALPEQYPPFFVAPRAPSAHSSHWRSRKRGGKRPAA
ncbi:MAG: HNH endonuclease, partial [Actinobacteria bacterium]|nr:HNH endonuclease [Actinomycetota bacterium]